VSSVADLVEAYRETAEGWNRLRADVGAADRKFVENHRIYQQLRESDAGRDAIAGLLTHDSIRVRGLAARHCIDSHTDEATSVLETIVAGDGLPAITARNTLRAYAGGTLNLDW